MAERLQKVIANSGYTSRRKAEELIKQGRVKVNGVTVTELGTKTKQGDFITVDEEPLKGENKVYYLLYKPKGYICSLHDEKGRPVVTDLFEDVEERIYPVGRLDYDTTGALLMTNDGEFANMVMHPRYHLDKIYDVTLKGVIDIPSIKALEKGTYIDGKKTQPCKIKILSKDEEHDNTQLQIRLQEGKNRQVKKMFEAVGYPVKRLHRGYIGGITLKGLKPGEYRRLKPQEVKDLKNKVSNKQLTSQRT